MASVILKSLFIVLCAFAGNVSLAQPYPSKPIRLIVTFSPGGSSDLLARGVAKQLSEQMGANVVVENRPGAGGIIGAEAVAKGPADGYQLLFGTISTHGIGPAIYRNPPFDAIKDFAPVSLMHVLPNVLIVTNSLPVHSVKDLVDYARANPGRVTFASAGNGSISHLAAEMFKSATDVQMTHIPYKGGGAASTDLISGQVSIMFETATNALAMARSGKVRAIAVTGITRWPQAPELPTVAEAGVPGYRVDSWTGLLAPAGVPRSIVERLNAELVKAVSDAGYRQQMNTLGVEAISSTPEEFQAFIAAEVAKWAQVVRQSGAKID